MSVRTLLFKWVSITLFVCNVKIVWLISFTNNNCGVLRITFSKSLIVKVELNEKLVKEGMDQSHVSVWKLASGFLLFAFFNFSTLFVPLFNSRQQHYAYKWSQMYLSRFGFPLDVDMDMKIQYLAEYKYIFLRSSKSNMLVNYIIKG